MIVYEAQQVEAIVETGELLIQLLRWKLCGTCQVILGRKARSQRLLLSRTQLGAQRRRTRERWNPGHVKGIARLAKGCNLVNVNLNLARATQVSEVTRALHRYR